MNIKPIWTDDGLIDSSIESKIQLDEMESALIDAAERAKAYSKVHTPIDYIDIGKKIGVSSTQGMELHAAAKKAYEEWKEKHHDNS